MQQKAETRKPRSLTFGLERLGLTALRYPAIVAALIIAATIGAFFGISRLQVDDSLSELFRSDTQEFRDYELIS
jgi:predicted RND superfamily exporter protein